RARGVGRGGGRAVAGDGPRARRRDLRGRRCWFGCLVHAPCARDLLATGRASRRALGTQSRRRTARRHCCHRNRTRVLAVTCYHRGMRVVALLVVLCACYGPTIREGAPCGAGNACPSGLVCEEATQTCVRDPSLPPVPDA